MTRLPELTPADPAFARYLPSRPFPPYRFVPGLYPHPVSDPRGHSYRGGAPEPKPEPLDPAAWDRSEDYLYGCDLYNFAYFWEAHEAWEGLWHLTTKADAPGLFLQGLIQASASQLKRHVAEPVGATKLARLSIEKLEAVAGAIAPRRRYLGLDIGAFTEGLRAHVLEARPGAPFPFLRLELPPATNA